MATPTTTTTSTEPPTAAATRRRGWLARFARRAGVGLLVLALLGGLIEAALTARDTRRFPAPGELAELGDGRHLRLMVAGEEQDGPTVVLEAGIGGAAPSWVHVQGELSEHVTVVSYDRPGMSWSDPPHRPVDAHATAADLHTALQARGLDGPHLLVRHSLGGLYVRVFAAAYPDEVVGLVLADPSHEDIRAVDPDCMATLDSMQRLMRSASVGAHVGLGRVVVPLLGSYFDGLPDEQVAQLRARSSRPGFLRAYADEMAAFDRLAAAAATTPDDFAGLPVQVLHAGDNPDPRWDDAHAAQRVLRTELADRSPHAQLHVLDDPDHRSMVNDADQAAELTAIILDEPAALNQP